MLDLRAPDLVAAPGERLVREVYKRDFRERWAVLRNTESWKIERRQHFEEQGSASRDALRRGDWEESLRLLEERRDALREAALDDGRQGHVLHRIRVVNEPLTPYLQWELHSLRLRAEYGVRVRVVRADAVSPAETEGILPEVTILGGRTLYRVLYTERGIPDGAFRYTDPDLVSRWVAYLRALYGVGEDVESYFTRHVAHLPPPVRESPTE